MAWYQNWSWNLTTGRTLKQIRSLATNIQKVFAAGDSVTGASLVVTAIASGRRAAKEIDKFLRLSNSAGADL